MLKTLTPLLGALLLAGATTLYAQTAPADGGPRGRHFDCKDSKDPKACEAQRKEAREKMKAAHEKARQACEGKKDAEHRDCMRTQMCAESKDPAKCEAHFKQAADAYNKAYDTCKSKGSGDEFRACMRQFRQSQKK